MNIDHDILSARQHVELCGHLCESALTIADECRRLHAGHRETEWRRSAEFWSDEAFHAVTKAQREGGIAA